MARIGISLPRLSSSAPRYRLHSRFFAFYCRTFSVLLFGGACQLVSYAVAPAVQSRDWQALVTGTLVVFAIVIVARYLWRRPKPIFATDAGLEIRSGKERRLIPWSCVLDVREMPSVRMQTFSRPRMWQVDLDGDERFDFCGTPDARKIVAEFIERAERSSLARAPRSR